MLIPTQQAPDLVVPTLAHGDFTLSQQVPQNFTMVVFFRGLHCPICATYLTDLAQKLSEFEALGVECIAVSSDLRDRAEQMAKKVGSSKLRYGYDFSISQARNWGLHISKGRGKTSLGVEELALYAEPGLFLIRPDNSLFYVSSQSMPFARPSFADMLGAVRFILEKNYPARGDVVAEGSAAVGPNPNR